MSGTRPKILLAMDPARTRGLVRPHQLQRLMTIGELLRRDPVTDFAGPGLDGPLSEVEVLLTGWGCPPVTADVLDRAPRLQAIAHAAGSVKEHVSPMCLARGIRVSSAAPANARPVAEFTLAAILFANKGVLASAHAFAADRTIAARLEDGVGNYRKRVGLVGASRVGRWVLDLLRPFDFEVVVHDPFLDPEEAAGLGAEWVELPELMRSCDVVSLHAPSVPSTRHMIDEPLLASMPDGATLINTARGALIDPAALEAELVRGRIHAVLDVTEPEPLPHDSPLWGLENVLLTPHVAGALGSETERLVDFAIDELERYARAEEFSSPVTPSAWEHTA